jgi:hypothetical protein
MQEEVRMKQMLAQTVQHNDGQDVPELPCPACIEAASQKRGEKELVPGYALKKYTFDQLAAHLESGEHNRRELVAVTLRASIYLYRQAFAHALEKI